MNFPIVWASEKQPSNDDYWKYVDPALTKIFKDLEKAEDLIFHTIFIGDSHDGPIVMAYGKTNDPNVYLDYMPEMEWIKLGS